MDVSVVVATFGSPDYKDLARDRAVPSAEKQTLAPKEIVAVHGLTLSDSRNWGASRTSSEWLCFLDADDELHPDYLERMAEHQFDADLLGPAVEYVRMGRAEAPKVWPEQDLRDGNYLVIGTLVRRSVFEAAGGFHEWGMYEDWCLWQRCHKLGARIKMVPDAVYTAHIIPGSRNRAPKRAERLFWHEAIRRANYPELYE